jgi:hypothetical protein
LSNNKSEIGGRILNSLLKYGKRIEQFGTNTIKNGRYTIDVSYHYLDFPRMYRPKDTGPARWTPYQDRKNLYTKRSLYVGFKGKLDFYKNFSMNYIFTDRDDNTQKLIGISERQFHNEYFSYWTTTYGLPFTEERLYMMLYDAMNLAFGYKNDSEKFEKLIRKIEMYTIREV